MHSEVDFEQLEGKVGEILFREHNFKTGNAHEIQTPYLHFSGGKTLITLSKYIARYMIYIYLSQILAVFQAPPVHIPLGNP